MLSKPVPPNTSGVLTDKERKLTETIDGLNAKITRMCDKIQYLHEVIKELKAENQRLKEDDETACKTIHEMKCDKVKADMFCVLEQYVRDDVDMDTIGCAVVAYVDLLDSKSLQTVLE